VLVPKTFAAKASRLVVSGYAYGEDVVAEVSEILDGVRSASGEDCSVAVLQDEHGSFAGDTRDFAEDEFVGDQISEDRDGYLGEGVNDLAKAVGFFGMLGHWI